MDQLIFALCAAMAGTCAFLLLRSYAATHYRLLLWSGICFATLTLQNALLLLDKTVFRTMDLYGPRLLIGLLAVCSLLYGLIVSED